MYAFYYRVVAVKTIVTQQIFITSYIILQYSHYIQDIKLILIGIPTI